MHIKQKHLLKAKKISNDFHVETEHWITNFRETALQRIHFCFCMKRGQPETPTPPPEISTLFMDGPKWVSTDDIYWSNF